MRSFVSSRARTKTFVKQVCAKKEAKWNYITCSLKTTEKEVEKRNRANATSRTQSDKHGRY